MKIAEPNFKINNYPMYGLNRHRSFMHAPLLEGEPSYLKLDTDNDVKNFCINVLLEYGCPESAIFVVFKDGRQKIYAKSPLDDEGNIHIAELESKENDMHMFEEYDGLFRLCCYNLIMEHEPGLWMIQS